MSTILVVETASPKRVRRTVEQILEGRLYQEPSVTILCRDDPTTVRYLSEIQQAKVVPLVEKRRRAILREVRGKRFDVQYFFWTGEKNYSRMKLAALRLRAAQRVFDMGDGSVVVLTWKACFRYWIFRCKHRLPTDHWDFLPSLDSQGDEFYDGEKVLIVQSADTSYILGTLDHLRTRPLFRNPRYSVFCRNRPEVVRKFQEHPMIAETRIHNEVQNSWKHLMELRRERFDAVVVFFTGDPSYWKIKYFAFLLGARRKVVVNENTDSFYFSWSHWLAFLAHRLGGQSRVGMDPRWFSPLRLPLFLLVKLSFFPLRFMWLLIVWLYLRSSATRHQV